MVATPPVESIVMMTTNDPYEAVKITCKAADSSGQNENTPVKDSAADANGPPISSGVASAFPAAPEISDTRSAQARKWSSLETITVSGFKAVKAATIPIDRVTILVGPNGCGKSSVLQAIHWAARAASYVLPKHTTKTSS